MSQLTSTIRPAPGADGPFYVVTEQDGVVANVTTTVASLTAALNQCRDDQGTLIQAQSLTPTMVRVVTVAT